MKAVILFDGVCNLCNGFVNFVIDYDKAGYFQFAAHQSAAGQALLKQHGLPAQPETVVYIDTEGHCYTQSSAALEICRHLDGVWPGFSVFQVVPPAIRDAAYRLVADNRYQILGKRETCRMPTPEVRSRFLGELLG
ncbi:MAG: DCC1-like thiol-disulfide oxidoreductase family protein [Cyanobacteria bacterium P01_H01_bin.121]